ncbi:hypothetical protein [Streptomyces sp. NBC_01304]|uniref:hypothetical protein n=1 Tax=Streptomyces sp. NBC_01304 TaxID=2903818 RepID=UPI002E151163|nr:hypothetical protein OG430_43035 [Streptomyces sp. NBC_01304]
MWPGQQPPGGEQNPQDPNQNPYQQPGYQQPNPYQQPGYQQQPGYPQQAGQPPQQQPGQAPQWNVPSMPGTPAPPPAQGGGGGRKKTTVIAVVAAVAVVIAAGVTGYLVLGGDKDKKDDEAGGGGGKKPTSSAPKSPTADPTEEENSRGNSPDVKAVVPGWQVVVNPRRGVAYDVPPGWVVANPDVNTQYSDDKDPEKVLITHSGTAKLKDDWCTYHDDEDDEEITTHLAQAGTKGANGAKNTGEAAENVVGWWIYAPYTQPDDKNIEIGKAKPFTSSSGLKGSISWAKSTKVKTDMKSCTTNGKAVSFAFKNSDNDYTVWSLYGVAGVEDELDKATMEKILGSVRLSGKPQGS